MMYDEVVINITYRFGHCTADRPCWWGRLSVYAAVSRCSWDDQTRVYCYGALCPCTICQIIAREPKLRSINGISIIIIPRFCPHHDFATLAIGTIIRNLYVCSWLTTYGCVDLCHLQPNFDWRLCFLVSFRIISFVPDVEWEAVHLVVEWIVLPILIF